MAKGRQPGVLAFGFKSFLEAVIRQQEGISFDREPTIKQKEEVDKKVGTLREAMKNEKRFKVEIKADEAPHTKAVLDLFLTQLRDTFQEVETATSLRDQLVAERMARESLMARLQEVEAQLERATKKKSA